MPCRSTVMPMIRMAPEESQPPVKESGGVNRSPAPRAAHPCAKWLRGSSSSPSPPFPVGDDSRRTITVEIGSGPIVAAPRQQVWAFLVDTKRLSGRVCGLEAVFSRVQTRLKEISAG